jgi:hypothetical protein
VRRRRLEVGGVPVRETTVLLKGSFSPAFIGSRSCHRTRIQGSRVAAARLRLSAPPYASPPSGLYPVARCRLALELLRRS